MVGVIVDMQVTVKPGAPDGSSKLSSLLYPLQTVSMFVMAALRTVWPRLLRIRTYRQLSRQLPCARAFFLFGIR